MAIIRWNPSASHDMLSFQDEVNRVFDQFLRSSSRANLPVSFTPPADIEESAEAFVLRLDLPGVSQQDVKVSLMGDTLTIRGERRPIPQPADGERSVHRTERIYGMFERSFVLGTPVRGHQVQATYRDGVLEIRVPKAEEARARDIDIQVG